MDHMMTVRYSLIAKSLILACFLFSSSVVLYAQDGVPVEILQRTVMIKVGDKYGSAFTIDYDGKLYLVTARHLVIGLPPTRATIEVRRAGKWEPFRTVKTFVPSSADVDIAVFETDAKVPERFRVEVESAGGVTMGQAVWFLGYPYGIASRLKDFEAPFIKRGTMSAIDASNPDAVILYIDGFNNTGFSGGPIIYWSFSERAYRIIGVVKGYRADTAKVLLNGQQVDTHILVNSGILVGYSIAHVVKAIAKR
jgi:hypothetical protein